MVNYILELNLDDEMIDLKAEKTLDDWVVDNVFLPVVNKMEEEHIDGGIGFVNYMHKYEKPNIPSKNNRQ